MTELPYIPPRYPSDPVSHELLVLFLDAVARVTEAFREFRDEIVAAYRAEKTHPTRQWDAWWRRWKFDGFKDYELKCQISSHLVRVMHIWSADPSEAAKLDVSCGSRTYVPAVGPPERHTAPTTMTWEPWDYQVESWDAYEAHWLAAFKAILKKQKAPFEVRLRRGLKPYNRRIRTRSNALHDFEWLAPSICKGWTDERIARAYHLPKKLGTDVVKKARYALRQHGFSTHGK